MKPTFQYQLLFGLVAFYLLTGLYLVIVPVHFYLNAPGVVDTGPYNSHFIRDVGFAFTLSALSMAYGIKSGLKPLVLFGASWLVTHGLFHLVLWFGHHAHFSHVALIDLAVVVLPALVTGYLSITLEVKNHD